MHLSDFLLYILAGGGVGFAVGLTGVGGGSLMTPLLLLFGFQPSVAIGTDLLYAGITKSSGVYFHQLRRNIEWRIVAFMALGSLPVSLFLSLFVMDRFREAAWFEAVLTTTLGIMLVLTSLVIAFQGWIQRRLNGNGKAKAAAAPTPSASGAAAESKRRGPPWDGIAQRHSDLCTLLMGMLLGLCVTLSSVGAGAFAAAILFLLYPRLSAVKIVGTDIAHAVPLTLVAGVGYLLNGFVDFVLLLSLLCGSLPGIYLGSRMGTHLPEQVLRRILAFLLFALGLNFSLGAGH